MAPQVLDGTVADRRQSEPIKTLQRMTIRSASRLAVANPLAPRRRHVTSLTSRNALWSGGLRGSGRDTLLTHGDYYMHLADLASYLEADGRLRALYADPAAWARTAILNVAGSGKFSSDRTISEYAADIWHVKPCAVS